MSSSENSSDLAGNIITYVGVPLAVAGVLPIIWTMLMTFRSSRLIKSKLQRNNISAKVHSDGITRTIEVQYQRFAITPKRPMEPRNGGLWGKVRGLDIRMICEDNHAMHIPGGTWAILDWEKRRLPDQTQRLQHPDELRQPQAEINFEDLVTYLYDLGAVPNSTGWRKLRLSGLWTPPNVALMSSPTDSRKPLLITTSFGHADSQLSFALTTYWKDDWNPPERPILPLYSICIPSKEDPIAPVEPPNYIGEKAEIICEFSEIGITTAYERSYPTSSEGLWFAAIVTALKISHNTMTWKFDIPERMALFCRAATVPCGVLELLGIIESSQTPAWRIRNHAWEYGLLSTSRRIEEEVIAEELEKDLPLEAREAVVGRRFEENHRRQRLERDYDNIRERENKDLEIQQALQSPKWTVIRVADCGLSWLRNQERIGNITELEDVVLEIVRSMILDPQFSHSICAMLDRWKHWESQSGMREDDIIELQERPETFTKATLVVAIIAKSQEHPNNVSPDLKECLRNWKVVKLG
ncbi:hypothetical protein GCG54_00013869 [Colletotrichum gloeosporioides]|uniref:Uncharacterized protein n=1 Tax=Colletotrichum gloeosporioides TaxID=474922 RepID=A0A8H4CVM4_COLGL|nr:uncharacterized protein GCG54_00013869 [Colletotrichum gloeosporioides]KAF3810627.1 hypothetical protein GCG54_00013869 [Colletotrichum gloeosporioides]